MSSNIHDIMSDIRRLLSAGAMSHCPSVDSVGYCNNTLAASDVPVPSAGPFGSVESSH